MKTMKKKSLRFASLLLTLVLCASFLPCAGAAEPDPLLTATYSSPALCTDAGKTVRFAECLVQFAYDAEPVSGEKLTWTVNGAAAAEFTPAAAGVTPVTVSDGTKTREVYVVAKNAADTEYVIYENDFNADPLADLRVVQQTSGTKLSHDAANGTLVLDSSNAGDAYLRVLLPKLLDAFGDAVIDARLKLSNPKGADSRWGSVMFRVQKQNYPYWHVCMRYDSTASNGTEIAERTSADAWNVVVKGAAQQTKDSFCDIRANVAGKTIRYSVNGKEVLSYDLATYENGAMGFQTRGLKMTVDSIRVSVNPNAGLYNNVIPGHYADVRVPASNVSAAPVLVTEIEDREALAALGKNSPAVAIFTYTDLEGQKGVVLGYGENGLDLEEPGAVVEKLDGKIIPAFRIASEEAADALAAFAAEYDLRDAYVLSDDLALVRRVKDKWSHFHGAIDYSSYSGSSFEAVRDAAVSAGARVVILPGYSMTRSVVKYLEDKYLSAWVSVDNNEASNVAAINCGVLGLVTTDRALSEACLTKFYAKNTLVLHPNVIGHRGVPSVAQENSLAGCIQAYEYGADMVENDIHLTADKVLYVMHDSTIDRTTTGTGTITSMTSKMLAQYQIKTIDTLPGEPIPTLEDYFKQFKGNGKTIVIELKSNNLNVAKPLADLITQYDILEQIVVISFYPEVITEVRKYLPGISGAALDNKIALSEDAVADVLPQVLTLVERYETAFSPSYASGKLEKKLVNALLARGVTTWAWTVNQQADFDSYFVAGTRGITTNYSQWATDYIHDLTYADGKVTAVTYGGKSLDVTAKAKLVVVDDGGTGITFDPTTGKFSGSAGTAQVFFTYEAATASGTKYSKVTELFSVEIGSEAPTDAPTAAPTDPAATDAPGTEPVAKKGCKSAAALPAAMLVLAAACAVRRKKED